MPRKAKPETVTESDATETTTTTEAIETETASTATEPVEPEVGTETAVAVVGDARPEPAEVIHDAEIVDEMTAANQPRDIELGKLDYRISEDEARYDLSNDPEFVASVRERGVLDAVTVCDNGGGRWWVTRGRRRILAALLTGHPTVPVSVVHQGDLSAEEWGIRSVADDIHTKDHRAALTHRERANRYAQMALYGAAPTRIAKETGHARDEVKAALAAVKSEAVMSAIDSGALTFEQGEIIAGYEADEDWDAVRELMNTRSEDFGYRAKRIALGRKEVADRARASLRYAEAGFSIVLRDEDFPDGEMHQLEELRTTEGEPVTVEMVNHAARLWTVYLRRQPHDVMVDRATGERVDDDAVDWDTRDDPQATPAEGLRHFSSVRYGPWWEPEFWLDDLNLSEAGLLHHSDAPVPAYEISDDPEHGSGAEDDDEAEKDAEREAAEYEALREAAEQRRAQAEADRETQRQYNRRRDELNRQGEAAKGERCEFLRKLVAKQSLPKGAQAYIAESLLWEPNLLNRHLAQVSGLDLLGLAGSEAARKHNANAAPGRSLVLVYALVLGANESRTPKDSWKGSPNAYFSDKDAIARYLLHLQAQGHKLQEVEQVSAGLMNAADVDIDGTGKQAEPGEVAEGEAQDEPAEGEPKEITAA